MSITLGLATGLGNGLVYNFGDEALGDDGAAIEAVYRAAPVSYTLGNLAGTVLSPLTLFAGRLPLFARKRGLSAALEALDRRPNREMLQDQLRALTRSDATPSRGLLGAMGVRRPQVEYTAELTPYNTTDDELLQAVVDRRRGAQELADELAMAHGAIAGLGGVAPGDTSIESRLGQALVGGALGLAATRGSADFLDLARGRPPFLSRASDEQVLDLAGAPVYRSVFDRLRGREAPIAPDDINALLRRMAGSEEASYRATQGVTNTQRTFETGEPIVRYGRAANVIAARGEQAPNVAPLSDPNSLTQALVGRAAASPEGRRILQERDDDVAIRTAIERAMGAVNRPGLPTTPTPAQLPDYLQEDFADALLRDPAGRVGLAQLVTGRRGWQDGQPLPPEQRDALRTLVTSRLVQEAQRISDTRDAQGARALIALFEDPAVVQLFRERGLAVRPGQVEMETRQLGRELERLQALAAQDRSRDSNLRSFATPDIGARELGMQLQDGSATALPLSRRLVEAVLDPQTLRTTQRRWATDPNDALRPDELVPRAQRSPLPYGRQATPGGWTEITGALLGGLGDRALHYGLMPQDR